MKENNRVQNDLTHRHRVVAKVDGKVFTEVSFFVRELAVYWFKAWQQSYAHWNGNYRIEMFENNKLVDAVEYVGDGRVSTQPDIPKPHKKKPFVPQVFPNFERPHYNGVVGAGKLSEKEIYSTPEKAAKKTAKKHTSKAEKKTTKKTAKKTTGKTVKKRAKK